jgi:pantothenate kinase
VTEAEVIAALVALPPGRRVVALAGPPASGKSTTAESIVAGLRAAGRTAEVVPMDGFHLDNADLDAAGLRTRKGAPETFDAEGLLDLVRRAKAGGAVAYPTFDRARDAVMPDGGRLEDATEIALFEGNYLLLDEDPWRDLHALWDATVFLDVAEGVLEARLLERWRLFDPDNAEARAQGNDLPNARRVMAGSAPPTYTIRSTPDAPPA